MIFLLPRFPFLSDWEITVTKGRAQHVLREEIARVERIQNDSIFVDHNELTSRTTGRHITRNLIFCQVCCPVVMMGSHDGSRK